MDHPCRRWCVEVITHTHTRPHTHTHAHTAQMMLRSHPRLTLTTSMTGATPTTSTQPANRAAVAAAEPNTAARRLASLPCCDLGLRTLIDSNFYIPVSTTTVEPHRTALPFQTRGGAGAHEHNNNYNNNNNNIYNINNLEGGAWLAMRSTPLLLEGVPGRMR